MDTHRKNISIMIKNAIRLLVVLLLAITACNTDQETTVSGKKKIVCTTTIVADAVRNIVGDSAEVISLMGAGIDPHLFKPTPQTITALQQADIIVANGLYLEGKMTDILKNISKQKTVIAMADGLEKADLIPVSASLYDPHIWFSVPLWAEACKYLTAQLIKIDTTHKDYYQDNLYLYIEKLTELHEDIIIELKQIPSSKRILITSHDAFHYFGKTYNIEVKSLQGISTVADFGVKDVENLVNLIVSRQIKAVFVETTISPKAMQAVVEGCKQKNHQVIIGGTLYTDALGNSDTPEGTYVGMLTSNLRKIVTALK